MSKSNSPIPTTPSGSRVEKMVIGNITIRASKRELEWLRNVRTPPKVNVNDIVFLPFGTKIYRKHGRFITITRRWKHYIQRKTVTFKGKVVRGILYRVHKSDSIIMRPVYGDIIYVR